MEEEFLNIGLDIIGLGVFNYDFGSISKESPVIKVALQLAQQSHCSYLSCKAPLYFFFTNNLQ